MLTGKRVRIELAPRKALDSALNVWRKQLNQGLRARRGRFYTSVSWTGGAWRLTEDLRFEVTADFFGDGIR